jgi:hypothetical protein
MDKLASAPMAFIKGALHGSNLASVPTVTQPSVIPSGFGGGQSGNVVGKTLLAGVKPNLLADHLAAAAPVSQKGKPGAASTTPYTSAQGGPTPTLDDPSKAIHGVLKQHS